MWDTRYSGSNYDSTCIKEALSAGITMFQFREKGATALRGMIKKNLQ